MTPEGPKYNLGAIIGGVVGAIVVAAGVGFIYYRRRKQRKSRLGRGDAQPTTDPKRRQHLQQEQVSQDSQQQQWQQQHRDQQDPDANYPRSYIDGAGPSVEHGSTYKGSLQHRLIDNGHMSASTTSITPLFARNSSARYSFNSGSSYIQQPPIELYEKGYYVPESSRRNPQFYDAAAIPHDNSGMVPVDVLPGEAPWMTPQSSRRNPQLVSEQLLDPTQKHHSLQRSESVASGGTLVVDDDDHGRRDDAGREAPVYHEACSNARLEGVSGNKGEEMLQEEATSITAAKIPADTNNTYHSPLQSAMHPTFTPNNTISATLIASGSQILDTATIINNNANETTDNSSNGRDSIKDEHALQHEMAMIHAQQAEYQQNLEWLRLESERLETERLANLDRLARLQNRQNF